MQQSNLKLFFVCLLRRAVAGNERRYGQTVLPEKYSQKWNKSKSEMYHLQELHNRCKSLVLFTYKLFPFFNTISSLVINKDKNDFLISTAHIYYALRQKYIVEVIFAPV